MDEETHFYRHADGSYSSQTYGGYEGTIEPPEGAVEITEAEYTEGVAAIEAANAQKAAEEEAAAQERARQDYEALIAAGIPPETAARMSGYNPPHPTVGSAQKTGK
ncbi:hypothetical protein NRF20_13060 [Streptomyces sp. R-74717]|uniref:hypothetical protein n=1 Tax=Streptomyces sp. R-74717 TaxID=2969820 RepID=UPI0039B55807